MTASYSQRKTHARHGAATINATVNAAVEAVAAEKDARADAAREAYRKQEAERHRYTREELAGARAIRTGLGWHKVARVNAKTVSVETAYSWVDRVPFDDVLEVLR